MSLCVSVFNNVEVKICGFMTVVSIAERTKLPHKLAGFRQEYLGIIE
jgi:hypothetical protein